MASAVGFVLDQNRSIKAVAEYIGTSEASLGKWVKVERERRAGAVPADAELNESERAELVRLREQAKADRATIAEQALQIEFAKKVATWFASQKQ